MTTVALVLHLALVARGGQVLKDVVSPGRGVALSRFAAYSTIESNLLVALMTARLTLDPHRDATGWRVVYVVLLRPLLDLPGPD